MPLVSFLHQIFQAIRSDTERFHGELQCVFEALFLSSLGALPLRHFAVEQFLREAVIFHVDNITGPTKLLLHQDGVDAGKRSLSSNFGVGDIFLLCDTKYLPKTGHVKGV